MVGIERHKMMVLAHLRIDSTEPRYEGKSSKKKALVGLTPPWSQVTPVTSPLVARVTKRRVDRFDEDSSSDQLRRSGGWTDGARPINIARKCLTCVNVGRLKSIHKCKKHSTLLPESTQLLKTDKYCVHLARPTLKQK